MESCVNITTVTAFFAVLFMICFLETYKLKTSIIDQIKISMVNLKKEKIIMDKAYSISKHALCE